MPRKKAKKSKGRPPKYVIDEQMREIVGLSYNKANNQYYLTFSNPREYLGTSKEVAIEKFKEMKACAQLPQDAQIEHQYKKEIYDKALELLECDPVIQPILEKKAKTEIDKIILNHEYAERYFMSPSFSKMLKGKSERLKDGITKRLIMEIDDKLHFCKKTLKTISNIISDVLGYHWGYGYSKDINEGIKEIFRQHFRIEAKRHFQDDKYQLAWEVAYDLIIANPIDAAHKTGIKELAYLEMINNNDDDKSPYAINMPLPWWLVWKIFDYEIKRKEKEHYIGDEAVWNCVGAYIGIGKSVDRISRTELLEAVIYDYSSIDAIQNRYDADKWKAITGKIRGRNSWHFPTDPKRRLSTIKRISEVVYTLGYGQLMSLIEVIEGMEKA